MSVSQVRYKVEEEVVDLIDFLVLEDEQLSLLFFDYVECASVLGLISKHLNDILIKHVLIIFLVLVFVLLLLLLLFLLFLLIVANVLNDLLDSLIINKGCHGLAWIQNAHRARFRVSHEDAAKVIVPHIKEGEAHACRGEELICWPGMNELLVDISERFHQLQLILSL